MSGAPETIIPILTSELTCPHCGRRDTETMPQDACVYFFECQGCGVMLKPKVGDCCVYCSYGSVPCPPIQIDRAAGDSATTCCRS